MPYFVDSKLREEGETKPTHKHMLQWYIMIQQSLVIATNVLKRHLSLLTSVRFWRQNEVKVLWLLHVQASKIWHKGIWLYWASEALATVQITFIFIGQTHLVFGKRVCTCVTKHSNAFRTFLNWLKNSKRVWHQPKLHILRLPIFANFDLWSVSVGWV